MEGGKGILDEGEVVWEMCSEWLLYDGNISTVYV